MAWPGDEHTTWLAVEAQLDTRDSQNLLLAPSERSQGRSQHASRQRFNLQRYRFCTREHQVYLYSPEGQEGGCFGVGGKEGFAGLAVRVIFQKVAK